MCKKKKTNKQKKTDKQTKIQGGTGRLICVIKW